MLSLSMNPLKQGLKPLYIALGQASAIVFIHESIKTRVETSACHQKRWQCKMSLSMNPLKQGLKQSSPVNVHEREMVFIHESIKTRVETSTCKMSSA